MARTPGGKKPKKGGFRKPPSELVLSSLRLENSKLKAKLKAAESRLETLTLRLESARSTKKAGFKILGGPPSGPSPETEVEVICADIHGNKHDPEALASFLSGLRGLSPHRVFLGGDILDCGGFLAEHHTLGYVAETTDSYEDDVAATNAILDAIQEAAPGASIHYLEGNHEWRAERWIVTQKLAHQRDFNLLRRAFAPENVLRLRDRGITYYPQGEIHSGMRVPGWVHYRGLHYVHKISNARDAAEVALIKAGAASVAYFDTHRASFKPKWLPSHGLVVAANPGCLCKRQPLYFHTRPTEWTQGYLVREIARSGKWTMTPHLIDVGNSFSEEEGKGKEDGRNG